MILSDWLLSSGLGKAGAMATIHFLSWVVESSTKQGALILGEFQLHVLLV